MLDVELLGAARDKVPAYASTMVGDDVPGGLDTPQAYARYAIQCKERGYPAFKLHTWQPPLEGAPSVKRDIAACAAVPTPSMTHRYRLSRMSGTLRPPSTYRENLPTI